MDELKVMKSKVLEAAEKCSSAKETLRTLFPEAFKDEWEVIKSDDICFSPLEHMSLVDKKTNTHFWLVLHGKFPPLMDNYKHDKNYFYRRVE